MATNQADRELNERLAAFTKTIAQGSGSMQQAAKEAAKRMLGSQDDIIDAYEDYLNKQRGWTTKEGKEIKDRLLRLRKLEKQEEAIRHEHSAKSKEFNKRLSDVGTEQAQLAAKIQQANNGTNAVLKAKLAADQQQLINKQNQIEHERKMALADLVTRHKIAVQAGQERQNLERQELKKTAVWGEALRSGMSGAISKAIGGATLGKAVVDTFKVARDAVSTGMKTGGFGIDMKPEAMGGSKFNTENMASMGFNPAEAVKMQAENRRAILSSSNGINEFVSGLEDAHERFRDTIADPLERSKVAIDSYNIAVSSGIRLTKSQATMFAKNIEKVSRYTGESATDFTKNVGNIMESEEVQNQLRGAASEDQRKAILDGIQAQYAQNRAMGMTAEQAVKTAKALAELDGRKGKTLIAQSAKVQMMAGVLGMGAKGAELKQLMMLRGDKTAEQKARQQELMAEMRNRADKKVMGKVTGAKIGYEEIFEQAGLNDVVGKDFNTNMNQAVSPQEKAFESMPQIPSELKTVNSTLGDIQSILEKSLYAQLAIGAAGTLLQLKQAGGGLKGLFGGSKAAGAAATTATSVGGAAATGGANAAGAAGAAANTANAASGLSKAAGILTKGAKILGPVAAVATGAMEGMDEYEKTGKMGRSVGKGTGAAAGGLGGGWGGAAAGAALGTMILPGVGTLIGGALGGLGGGLLGSWAGGKAGGKIGEKFDTAEKTKTDPTNKEEADAETEKTDETKRFMVQIKKMDAANTFLKTIAEVNQKQLDVAEKQLVALTMSEQEKSNADMRANLRKDNRFGSQYGYV